MTHPQGYLNIIRGALKTILGRKRGRKEGREGGTEGGREGERNFRTVFPPHPSLQCRSKFMNNNNCLCIGILLLHARSHLNLIIVTLKRVWIVLQWRTCSSERLSVFIINGRDRIRSRTSLSSTLSTSPHHVPGATQEDCHLWPYMTPDMLGHHILIWK